MGKYDEDLSRFVRGLDREITPTEYFLCKIAGELAEQNRLTRQKLTMPSDHFLEVEDAVDKA